MTRQRPPSALRSRSASASWGRLYGWSGRSLVAVVLVVFTLFFVIPIVWLLIAVTKSGSELAHRGAVPARHRSAASAATGTSCSDSRTARSSTGFSTRSTTPVGALILTAGGVGARPATRWP